MKMLSEGKIKVKIMGNVLCRTAFPINSKAKKIVRLRPHFPQIKKALPLLKKSPSSSRVGFSPGKGQVVFFKTLR